MQNICLQYAGLKIKTQKQGVRQGVRQINHNQSRKTLLT